MKNDNVKMQNVSIWIDTSSNQEIIVELRTDNKKDQIKEKIGKQKAQVVLPLIDQLLKKHNLTLQDIHAIEVNTGPGSFTGLRVGIAIANALAFSLNISVNNNPIGIFVQPQYE